jgi:hypothetical protein
MTRSLYGQKVLALRAIDQAAGVARLRYITDVPGQQAVYMVKLQEATAYLVAHGLDDQAPVPPYIAAEAASLGIAPVLVATQVVQLGTLWNEQLGPAIEGARLGGKRAVQDAATVEAVAAALAAALSALQAL